MLTIALTCSYAHHHNHRCCAHMHAQLHRHLYMFTFTIAHIGHICTHTIADIVCAHPSSQLPSVHTYTHTHLQTSCAHLHAYNCRHIVHICTHTVAGIHGGCRCWNLENETNCLILRNTAAICAASVEAEGRSTFQVGSDPCYRLGIRAPRLPSPVRRGRARKRRRPGRSARGTDPPRTGRAGG